MRRVNSEVPRLIGRIPPEDRLMSDAQEPSFSELLDGARRGDAAQRDRLFDACRSYLGVVARAQVETWLRAKVDASDLVQQTLLEAHRDFDRFDGATGGEWLAWLRRILAHNAADFVRHYKGTAKRQIRREVALAAPGGRSSLAPMAEPAAQDKSPSQQVVQQDDELRLAAAIGELSPDHAEVVMLRNLQRLPFDEVARRMGRTRPAVQMLWMRAIKRLQKQMRTEDDD